VRDIGSVAMSLAGRAQQGRATSRPRALRVRAEIRVVKVVPLSSLSPLPTTRGCTLRRTRSSPFPGSGR